MFQPSTGALTQVALIGPENETSAAIENNLQLLEVPYFRIVVEAGQDLDTLIIDLETKFSHGYLALVNDFGDTQQELQTSLTQHLEEKNPEAVVLPVKNPFLVFTSIREFLTGNKRQAA